MMSLCAKKLALREVLKNARRGISLERRQIASETVFKEVSDYQGFSIVSFASLSEEINLWPLNRRLAEQGHLFLPKIAEQNLTIYKVDDLEQQLSLSPWGIWEPIPEKCLHMPIDQITHVFVPGLGFDRNRRRIGYGKGYYDRFLTELKKQVPHALAVGIGFQEQLVSEDLPFEMHDCQLDGLLFG